MWRLMWRRDCEPQAITLLSTMGCVSSAEEEEPTSCASAVSTTIDLMNGRLVEWVHAAWSAQACF